MCNRQRSADRSPDQQPLAPARESAHQHAAASTKADFGQIFSVVTIALELAFRIHIAAIVQVGVHEHRIQH